MKAHLHGFIDLLFPRRCLGCSGKLLEGEDLICLICSSDLPLCRFKSMTENAASRQFWGRVELEFVNCYCFHTGSGVLPNLLHQLKYGGRGEVGHFLGARFAAELKEFLQDSSADWLIPIPLHPSKQRQRGYNQSERIANGISSESGIPVEISWLKRIKKGKSQTRKNRWKRSQDSQSVFRLDLPEAVQRDHFILVDDVITTGATIEACALLFKSYPNCRVSVLGIAYTWS